MHEKIEIGSPAHKLAQRSVGDVCFFFDTQFLGFTQIQYWGFQQTRCFVATHCFFPLYFPQFSISLRCAFIFLELADCRNPPPPTDSKRGIVSTVEGRPGDSLLSCAGQHHQNSPLWLCQGFMPSCLHSQGSIGGCVPSCLSPSRLVF